ncbi:hypothetical protein DY000_02002569 [Brassica cretica]|uniref:Transmembrane protein n=1 Tax=Brassica cretica TaxID=69181 RepID=A0ABQ7C8P9_BRACR|nr:hypothetical protein DY000_02002569 [Brassica cretica]
MIYRKWSLLSGPPVILGGAVVAAVAVGILVQNGNKRRMSHQTSEEGKDGKKMIYRKWSLLSGPPVILGGAVVAAVAVGILVQNVTKGEQKKNVSSNK